MGGVLTDWQKAVNTIAHALNKAGFEGDSPESKALELLAGRCEGTADAKEIAAAAIDANTMYQREYLPSHYAQYGEFGDSDHLVLRVDYIAETIAPLLKPSVDARLLGYAVEIKGDETNNEWTVGSFHSLPGPALDDARAAEEEALESGYNYETRITPTYSAAKPSVDVKKLAREYMSWYSEHGGAADLSTMEDALVSTIDTALSDSSAEIEKLRKELDLTEYELEQIRARMIAILDDAACPECGCGDSEDAESKECGCEAPVCAIQRPMKLGEAYHNAVAEIERLRARLESIDGILTRVANDVRKLTPANLAHQSQQIVCVLEGQSLLARAALSGGAEKEGEDHGNS